MLFPRCFSAVIKSENMNYQENDRMNKPHVSSDRYCDGLLQRPLLHVVLGRDGKPAGNLVNPGTYQLVYNWLTSDFKNMASRYVNLKSG